MQRSSKEYIKIDGANNIISDTRMLLHRFEDAENKTQLIKEYKKEKYAEMEKANALSISLLTDIQELSAFFIKKDIAKPPEPKRKRGRPRKAKAKQTKPKRKRGRPRKSKPMSKAAKLKRMRSSLEDLKRSLKKR